MYNLLQAGPYILTLAGGLFAGAQVAQPKQETTTTTIRREENVKQAPQMRPVFMQHSAPHQEQTTSSNAQVFINMPTSSNPSFASANGGAKFETFTHATHESTLHYEEDDPVIHTTRTSSSSSSPSTNFPSSLKAYLHQPKSPLKITLVLTGIGTTILFLAFKKTERTFHSAEHWCNWKKEIKTQKLETTEDIATDLIRDIQAKYTVSKKAYDFVEPLKNFISELEQEINDLSSYVYLGNFMHKVWLGKLFGVNPISLEQSEDRLTRVKILKRIFISWTADFKLKNNAYSTVQPMV